MVNLRQQTDKPAELEGEAFHEKEVLDAMNGPGRAMVLRDTSAHRMQLAFIFWDEATMAGMLDILAGYPLADSSTARLHNRLCFAGLAAIALGRVRNSDAYAKLGKDVRMFLLQPKPNLFFFFSHSSRSFYGSVFGIFHSSLKAW